MPYISTEDVRAKRNVLKKEFPEFKFSVRRSGGSSIHVDILEAPFNMLTEGSNYEQVNQFYIAEHYKHFPKISRVLLRIYEILKEGNYIENEDGDYGSIPHFYVNISIGNWEKPFQVKQCFKHIKSLNI